MNNEPMKGIEHGPKIRKMYEDEILGFPDIQTRLNAKGIDLSLAQIRKIALLQPGIKIRTASQQKSINCRYGRKDFKRLKNLSLIKLASLAMYNDDSLFI